MEYIINMPGRKCLVSFVVLFKVEARHGVFEQFVDRKTALLHVQIPKVIYGNPIDSHYNFFTS